MATVNATVTASFSASIGAEVMGFDLDPAKVIAVDDQAYNVQTKVIGAGSAVVLWDASTAPFAAFRCGFILVDPESNSTTQTPAQEVNIRLTVNGVTHLQKRDRLMPMLLGKSAQDTGAITKVEALPVSGSVANTSDVNVRFCCMPIAV